MEVAVDILSQFVIQILVIEGLRLGRVVPSAERHCSLGKKKAHSGYFKLSIIDNKAGGRGTA